MVIVFLIKPESLVRYSNKFTAEAYLIELNKLNSTQIAMVINNELTPRYGYSVLILLFCFINKIDISNKPELSTDPDIASYYQRLMGMVRQL